MRLAAVNTAARFGLLSALACCGCRDTASNNDSVQTVARPRRTPPPTGVVRALPPHAVRSDGIGPYRLGASLATQLDELPSGPRLTLLDIPGVVHSNLIRAEQGGVLVGGDPMGPTTFVAVVAADVARTEAGLAVGATRSQADIAGKLAPPVRTEARDPRLSILADNRAMRLVFDNGDVLRAMVVMRSLSAPSAPVGAAPTDAVPVAATGFLCMPVAAPNVEGAECTTPNGEIIRIKGDELSLRAADAAKAPSIVRLRGLVWFAPIDVDGREALIVVSRNDSTGKKTWSLTALRPEQGKWLRIADQNLFSISTENARWIGGDVANIDTLIEVSASSEGLSIGGIMIMVAAERIRDLVPLLPITVRLRTPGKVPPDIE
jgi:hypothetical protein